MNSQNKKSLRIVLIVVIAILTLAIGYASINAVNFIFNGNATVSVNDDNFKVYFISIGNTPNISSNVTVTGDASINTLDNTKAEFDVAGLTKEGDYAIATYTIINNSNSIGADISLYITNSNPEYFRVTETITDSQLQAGDTTTATIKVELIKTPLNNDVSTSVTGTLKADAIENESATALVPKSKASDDPESFATDSWETIQTAVRNNNTSAYNVGDTKTVTINNKNYTIRIVNKSTGEHCGDEDTAYSQTACGFVVEFVDIVERIEMIPDDKNVGGYPATLVYDYLANTLYGQLPQDLQMAIKPTRVISGYGRNDSANFTTNDKLYLLSGTEIYGTDLGGNNLYDNAAGTTHQLEYYSNNGVTYNTSSSSGTNLDKVRKNSSSLNTWYWLRTPISGNSRCFASVHGEAYCYYGHADTSNGVAPAFRIG